MAELLAAPLFQFRTTCRSENDTARTLVTGSGRSSTEIVTLPHAYRVGSSVASATSYCRVVSVGSALPEMLTASLLRSALGVTLTPDGRLPPSRPRIATTLSGVSGNGLVALSLARTSMVTD